MYLYTLDLYRLQLDGASDTRALSAMDSQWRTQLKYRKRKLLTELDNNRVPEGGHSQGIQRQNELLVEMGAITEAIMEREEAIKNATATNESTPASDLRIEELINHVGFADIIRMRTRAEDKHADEIEVAKNTEDYSRTKATRDFLIEIRNVITKAMSFSNPRVSTVRIRTDIHCKSSLAKHQPFEEEIVASLKSLGFDVSVQDECSYYTVYSVSRVYSITNLW